MWSVCCAISRQLLRDFRRSCQSSKAANICCHNFRVVWLLAPRMYSCKRTHQCRLLLFFGAQLLFLFTLFAPYHRSWQMKATFNCSKKSTVTVRNQTSRSKRLRKHNVCTLLSEVSTGIPGIVSILIRMHIETGRPDQSWCSSTLCCVHVL